MLLHFAIQEGNDHSTIVMTKVNDGTGEGPSAALTDHLVGREDQSLVWLEHEEAVKKSMQPMVTEIRGSVRCHRQCLLVKKPNCPDCCRGWFWLVFHSVLYKQKDSNSLMKFKKKKRKKSVLTQKIISQLCKIMKHSHSPSFLTL